MGGLQQMVFPCFSIHLFFFFNVSVITHVCSIHFDIMVENSIWTRFEVQYLVLVAQTQAHKGDSFIISYIDIDMIWLQFNLYLILTYLSFFMPRLHQSNFPSPISVCTQAPTQISDQCSFSVVATTGRFCSKCCVLFLSLLFLKQNHMTILMVVYPPKKKNEKQTYLHCFCILCCIFLSFGALHFRWSVRRWSLHHLEMSLGPIVYLFVVELSGVFLDFWRWRLYKIFWEGAVYSPF